MNKGVKLYLVPPYGIKMGMFDPKVYNKNYLGEDPAYSPTEVKNVMKPVIIESATKNQKQ